jgi:hypothetical protein
MAEKCELKLGDRVIRTSSIGAAGTVSGVRVDTTRASIKEGTNEAPGITITVIWDNGTTSHLLPNSLQKAN